MTLLLSVVICCGFVGLSAMAIGQETAVKPTLPKLRHGLQDMQFLGPLAIGDETKLGDDVLTFRNGKFSSQLCLKYGFTPAPYWVRRYANGLHFRADLQSPEQGTMEFKGVFDGEEMLATALWTKERWYWTITQQLRFKGHPSRHAD